MCSMCGDVQPLTIVAKDESAADALVGSLISKGAGLRDTPGGDVTSWPTSAENVVTIPFAGDPEFALAVAQLAFSEGHVTEFEAQAMLDRGYAAATGVTYEQAVAERQEHERKVAEQEEAGPVFGDMDEELEEVEEFLRSMGIIA